MEITPSKKAALAFGGAFIVAGVVLSTIVFPFWNLIREDVYERVEIILNDGGVCYVETADRIPKTIQDCALMPGDAATIKFGKGLAWATVVDGGS